MSLDHTLPSIKEYAAHLKCSYDNLDEISTQLFFGNKAEKQFIDIALAKSLEKDTKKQHYNSEHVIKDEVVYDNHQYWHYDKIFEGECDTYQLFLIEGDAGTGKTSLTYKVCKTWAKGEVLQKYSCIVLVRLRDVKLQDNVTLEILLAATGQSVNNDLCTEISRTRGKGILIWLDGWDELDNNLVTNLAFDNLLKGLMLPLATVVITTRPSATRSLKKYKFTQKFKIIGFVQDQIKKYVTHYCADPDKQLNLAEAFMIHLKTIPGLVHLARVPLYLFILVNLFIHDRDRQLPRKLIDVCKDFLLACLQRYKHKKLKDNQPITTFDRLPPKMLEIFHKMQKCAYERFLHHSSEPFTEDEISECFFNSAPVPEGFDGFGIFHVEGTQDKTGISKKYDFIYKPIQELLTALYLCRLNENDAIKELSEIFGKKEFEMVWVFYAGLTELKLVPLERVIQDKITLPDQSSINLPAQSHDELLQSWKQCRVYYEEMEYKEFLLTLILCCHETKNSEACRIIADHLYAD